VSEAIKKRVERVLEWIEGIGKELSELYHSVLDMDSKDLFEEQGYRLSMVVSDLKTFLEWLRKGYVVIKEEETVKTKEDICCVCGHSLSSHIDEGEYWRCHAIGSDGSQCECRLLKSVSDDIQFWNLRKRVEENLKELLGKGKE